MMNNEIPRNLDRCFTLAEDAADGLASYQVAIGVKQNQEADVRHDLALARNATADYDLSRSRKSELVAAQTAADASGRAFLLAARKVLALRLGEQWSVAWLPAGFPNNSTAVPDLMENRQSLLFALKDYFTANPGHEVAGINVTAAQAGLLAEALSAARSAVNEGATLSGQKKQVRDDLVPLLRARLRGLVAELGQLLDDNDPRWRAFGFNLPSTATQPDAPDAPALTTGATGTVLADWDDVPRTDYYRVFKQVIGTDAEFMFVARANDSDYTLAGLPSGATVKVQVSAVNSAGESSPGQPAQIVVP